MEVIEMIKNTGLVDGSNIAVVVSVVLLIGFIVFVTAIKKILKLIISLLLSALAICNFMSKAAPVVTDTTSKIGIESIKTISEKNYNNINNPLADLLN